MAGFTERMIGAATLDVGTYEEVEHDQSATGQAAGVVALVAIAGAIGSYGTGGLYGSVGQVVYAFIAWAVWAAITLLIGTKVFGGTADMGEMLRTLGFAQSVGVIKVLGIIPILGWIASLAAGLWMLVCGVVAIRQALDFTTGKAVGTVLLGWLVMMVLGVLLGGFVGGMTGALS
ncbi:MAG: YIP1 family protein [Gemmatimonadota bacterium]|nr:MAG: YIP1 family protein [Gemmatimonadota bacterium]